MAQHNGKFVAYFRVSKQKQGKSGLGVEAQSEAVKNYLNGGDWQIVAEFTEVELGGFLRETPSAAGPACSRTGPRVEARRLRVAVDHAGPPIL